MITIQFKVVSKTAAVSSQAARIKIDKTRGGDRESNPIWQSTV
jgi:hypothetical protein